MKERLRNNLFCVEWDVNLKQSIQNSFAVRLNFGSEFSIKSYHQRCLHTVKVSLCYRVKSFAPFWQRPELLCHRLHAVRLAR